MPKNAFFANVKTVGGLLPSELLQRVAALDKELGGLEADDYHLVGERLGEAISRSWGRMLAVWGNFQNAWAGLPPGDAASGRTDESPSRRESATGLTRDKLLLPLFGELGYGRLPLARGLEVDGKAYPISHLWNGVPIHLVGAGVDLDRRTPGAVGAARQSPHGLVQEYLNRSEALWGFVANGLKLRLLRDNAAITRQAYVEFDLEAIFEAEAYPDFALLWLLAHESRVFSEGKPPSGCWLERWQEKGAEQGKRALGRLREGVREAIEHLGRGFLKHPANTGLKEALRSGSLTPQGYYRELLRLVYRLLFLFVAEDRDVLLERVSDGATPEEREALEAARRTYLEHYSTARLRRIAERVTGTRHPDLYRLHRLVAGWLSEGGAPQLALKPLNSMLFDPEATPHLSRAELANRDFLDALRSLAFTQDDSVLRPVDYKNLGAEELGSVYEQLLELVPEVDVAAAHFALQSLSGNERKTSGSYYTPTALIEVVLDEALNPKLEEALKAADPERALLSLKVVDPAVGSGHFLIAAAHRIARALARLRSGEDEPSPEAQRSALRDVIRHCLYGVDVNEMSAELCRVALWMEMAEPGKPLGFLDHHIKVGNSLLGAPPNFYELGIPAEAHKRADVSEEARARSKALGKKKLEAWRSQTHPKLFKVPLQVPPLDFPEDSLEQVRSKAQAYREWRESEAVRKYEFLADYWTAAWFARPGVGKLPDMEGLITLAEEQFTRLGADELRRRSGLAEPIDEAKRKYRFFHWWLEFAEVFFDPESGELKPGGGFDVVLGNPPWERVKLQEKEFFAGRHEEIAQAENAAKRKRLIEGLKESDPALYTAFQEALNAAENVSNFLRTSGRYPLTGGGDVNTYQVFAELGRAVMGHQGRAGVIVPTGIATDDSNKEFFADLVGQGQLAALLDFENREGLFPAVDSRMKFSILALRGRDSRSNAPAKLTFFATNVAQLKDPERVFSLTPEDFALLNPNTRTCPVFRTRADAELTKKIYRRVPVLWKEEPEENPWGIKFMRLFDMSNDSSLFKTRGELEREGYRLLGNRMVKEGSVYLPLYEAKLIWHFDHRFATYESHDTRDIRPEEHVNPELLSIPNYWVLESDVEESLLTGNRSGEVIWHWSKPWLMGFRRIARNTDERTGIFSLLPRVGAGDSIFLMLPEKADAVTVLALLSCLNSLPQDYVTRQKVGGTNMSFHFVKQFPVLEPRSFTSLDLHFIVPRVLELTYTAWDLAPFAQDVWEESGPELRELLKAQWEANGGHPDQPPAWAEGPYPFPPFRWDEERRALLRAELDAYYAKLYGLTREELCYILEPQSVKGPHFPGETFRVLKEKEIKAYGEYRTMRLVLEAWDRLEQGLPARSEVVFQKPVPQPRHDRREVALAYMVKRFSELGVGGRTRLQKMLYFAQTHANVPLGLRFRRMQYGPFDEAVYRLEDKAIQDGWLERHARGNMEVYQPRPGIESLLEEVPAVLGDAVGKVEEVFTAFTGQDTAFIEAVTTLYAAWNDALLEGRQPSDQEIIREAKYDWHQGKELTGAPNLRVLLQWMREIGLVPRGRGSSTKA